MSFRRHQKFGKPLGIPVTCGPCGRFFVCLFALRGENTAKASMLCAGQAGQPTMVTFADNSRAETQRITASEGEGRPEIQLIGRRPQLAGESSF